MVASVSELQEYRMPSLPRNLEAGRGKTKGEWVAEAGVIVATDSDDEGYSATIASPIEVAEEPKRSAGPAPEIGEHSSEILMEHGVTEAEIAALIEAGVVGQHRVV